MHHFCTYFDRYYLPRALALHESLSRYQTDFILHALCLDQESADVLNELQLPKLRVIALDDFLSRDAELAALRSQRQSLDFYFTCTPAIVRYMFATLTEPSHITYLDADLYCYANLDPLLSDYRNASAAIIEHRFPPERDRAHRFGRFNVGLLQFRRSRWREQCLAWCADKEEPGRFGDQMYLDEWPQRYTNVCVIDHAGANVAVWNLARHHIRMEQDRYFSDTQPLLFVHFHRFRRVLWRFYDPVTYEYDVVATPAVRAMFRDYARAIERAERHVAAAHPRVAIDIRSSLRGHAGGSFLARARTVFANWRRGRYWWL
jgi:lipopolysaccharide biosynthesis glycosyltransferase